MKMRVISVADKNRCGWCNRNNPLYVEYHDNEWCRPCFDDLYLFEMLVLESFQAGLSWECVLNKRENFRKAFDGFDPSIIKDYDSEKINELMNNKEIIRNRKKIVAAVNNSRIFLNIAAEYGSFSEYLKVFTHGITVFETGKTSSPLSDAVSRDLKKRGMAFVGSTIIYSFLQGIGAVYSHEKDCFLYKSDNKA